MNNKTDLLSAQTWLEQEGLSDPIVKWTDNQLYLINGYPCSTLMERYANQKTKYLQGAILDFRNKLLLNGGLNDFKLLKTFDEHFGIQEVRPGDV